MMSKSQKKEYSIYLDQKLVEKLDNAIFPHKRSNILHLLILEYLIKKNAGNPPTDFTAKQTQTAENGDVR